MAYTGELQRNSPFSFQTPSIFSPWVDRLLIELRRRLRAKSQNAISVRRIVKMLEANLNEVAKFVLENPAARTTLANGFADDGQRHELLNADTPAKVRVSMSDYDLKFGPRFECIHLLDTPPGLYDIDLFEKCAVFALWKFAASEEAFDSKGASRDAISLAMEGMEFANLAIAVDDSEIELAREMHHTKQIADQTVEETVDAKKQEGKAVRAPAAKAGNEKLWGKYKLRSFELASSGPFKSYSAAANFIQSALQIEMTRHAEQRSIAGWLKKMGWRPTKPARP
jgi:hypothetical protein